MRRSRSADRALRGGRRDHRRRGSRIGIGAAGRRRAPCGARSGRGCRRRRSARRRARAQPLVRRWLRALRCALARRAKSSRLMTDLEGGARARARRRARAPPREVAASRASCPCASASRGWSTPDSFVEEALLANWEQEGFGADGVVTGMATRRRPAGRADGQRPDREGRLLGPEDRREDHPHPGAGARAPGADDLPGRLRRRAHHRPGRRCSPAAAAPGASSTPR